MIITDLLQEIEDNKTKYCKKQIQFMKLIQNDLSNSAYVYNEIEPLKIIKFIESLVQYQGEFAGQKISLLNWQKLLLLCMYGFRDKSDNTLLFTTVFNQIGKKNGKTLLGSALLLYNLLSTNGTQIYTVATDYPQSQIAYENVKQFILSNDKLKKLYDDKTLLINDRELSIIYKPTVSKFRCISEDRVKNIQGFMPYFLLYDEVASYRSNEIISKLDSAKPKNAISLNITTAEKSINNPGYALYQRSEGILNGKYVAPNFLPYIFELDEGDEWTDSKNYIKANPSLDKTTITTKKLLEERDKALQDPDTLLSFKAYNLNIWSRNGTQGISDDDWSIVVGNYDTYKEYLTDDKLVTYPCYLSVDLSKTDDYTTLTRAFFIAEINKFYVQHQFYIPEALKEKKIKTEKGSIQVWLDQGLITPTLGAGLNNNYINYDYVKKQIIDDCAKYKILGLAIDPAWGGVQLVKEISMELPNLEVFNFDQKSNSICPANRLYLDLIRNSMLIDNNPVSSWMVSNARIKLGQTGLIYFEKITDYKSSTARIDSIDTSVMALAQLQATIDTDIKADKPLDPDISLYLYSL